MNSSVVYMSRDLEALSNTPNYYEWILKCFRPHLKGSVVEFGAGIGTVSKLLLPHVETLDLYEPSQNLLANLQGNFKSDERVNVSGDMLEEALKKNQKKYDAVVMVNVLEHIKDDDKALIGLHSLLKPGGKLLLYVPAMPFLFSEFDHGLGHFRRYTRKTFQQKMLDANFTIRHIRYMDVLGIMPWYLVYTLGKKMTTDPQAAKIYDSIGVPFTKFFERFISFPFGKNLISVAEKQS